VGYGSDVATHIVGYVYVGAMLDQQAGEPDVPVTGRQMQRRVAKLEEKRRREREMWVSK
jgi:hypothetical protein